MTAPNQRCTIKPKILAKNAPHTHDPIVWTGCGTQVSFVHEDRKSHRFFAGFVSGLFDRLAGRGLDGNTHAPVVSFSERLHHSQVGHQTLRAFLDPFHAVISFANSCGVLPVRRLPRLKAVHICLLCTECSRQCAQVCWQARLQACSCACVRMPV